MTRTVKDIAKQIQLTQKAIHEEEAHVFQGRLELRAKIKATQELLDEYNGDLIEDQIKPRLRDKVLGELYGEIYHQWRKHHIPLKDNYETKPLDDFFETFFKQEDPHDNQDNV